MMVYCDINKHCRNFDRKVRTDTTHQGIRYACIQIPACMETIIERLRQWLDFTFFFFFYQLFMYYHFHKYQIHITIYVVLSKDV